jgi:hypothetical protein
VAVTISLYNHTSRRFADGSNSVNDTYKLMLCASATFDASDETLADIVKTESTTGTGYTSGGQILDNVSVTTPVSSNDAVFDADDVDWTASGGPIEAAAAILYNDSDAADPPVAFIDFGQTESAGDTTDFRVVWNASGIISFAVT